MVFDCLNMSIDSYQALLVCLCVLQSGSTALHLACKAGHSEIVRCLVDYDEATADGRDTVR